jgi:hypothetical protein
MVISMRNKLAAILLAAASIQVSAHHSTAAYDSQGGHLEGTVTQVHWVNPHSYIYMVIDADGTQTKWQVRRVRQP